jgi:exopolyphosphatase / guanosine-5'-triphosphate,3'-diphosphate pyrophosphatase
LGRQPRATEVEAVAKKSIRQTEQAVTKMKREHTDSVGQPAGSAASPVRQVAVIDIGSTSIRMAIAEIADNQSVRTLESLTRPVSLGKDTFDRNAISKSTIEECVRVLRTFRQKLGEYRIESSEQIRVVATSAVREAGNRLAFQDRVFIATGFEVDVLDEAEASRVTYMGVLPFLQPLLQAGEEETPTRSLIVEAGGGSTEVLVVQGQDVTVSQTYRLGSLRLRQQLETIQAPWGKKRSLMENEIRQNMGRLSEHLDASEPLRMIAIGGDVRFAAKTFSPDWNTNQAVMLNTDDLEAFTDQLLGLSVDDVVERFQLSFQEAEMVAAALLIYVELARMYGVDEFLVCNANLRDGLLKEMSQGGAWTNELSQQITRSAIDLGRKFHFDEPYARHVADLSRTLFRQLQDKHELDSRHELVLYVGALLHEVGLYISHRAYHKHSMYMIRNSELFGLGERDVLLVSLVARYHRRNTPQPSHNVYAALNRENRIAVAKMAAILRLAVALDHSRSHRIVDVHCRTDGNILIISVAGVDDLSLEQIALEQNSRMFESVFGVPVLLRPEPG